MESFYLPIKYTHMTLVVITLLLFNLRFWLRTIANFKLPQAIAWLPHLNDTLLLLSGMMMMTIAHWAPFGQAKWLGTKFLFVLLYILCGMFAMKQTVRSKKSFIAYGAAMSCIACVVFLAIYKPL